MVSLVVEMSSDSCIFGGGGGGGASGVAGYGARGPVFAPGTECASK